MSNAFPWVLSRMRDPLGHVIGDGCDRELVRGNEQPVHRNRFDRLSCQITGNVATNILYEELWYLG